MNDSYYVFRDLNSQANCFEDLVKLLNYMHNSFFLLGLNYRKADTIKRGRFSLQHDKILQLLKYNLDKKMVAGCFCLSTCNRTEIYGFAPNIEPLYQLLCAHTAGTREELEDIHFHLEGKEAFRHLFRVSSGLESQILGDFEIVSQVKSLFHLAQKAGSLNAITDRMLNHAIKCSKRIKNETNLSTGTASVSYSAVKYILGQKTVTQHSNITLYGMGKIGSNTCQNLMKYLPIPKENITLVVRNEERLKEATARFDLKVETQDKLPHILQHTDVLIVATGASYPLITDDNFPKGKKMLVIDLSIPCNVAAEIRNKEGVTYTDIDQLNQSIHHALSTRKRELPKAESIIQESLSEFLDWVKARQDMSVISDIKKRLSEELDREIQLLKKKHTTLDEDQANIVSQTLLKRLTRRLALGIGKDQQKTAFLRDLFDLPTSNQEHSTTLTL